MTDLTWSAIRADTVDRFHGQTPRPDDEAAIIDLFEIHPQLVTRAIDEMVVALNDGKVRYPWSALKARLERGTNAVRDVTVDTRGEKAKRIKAAEQWIHNAGLHYDLERHVTAELFGDELGGGMLRDYANDQALRTRLIALWKHERETRGIPAEQAAQTYADKCRDSWARQVAHAETKRKAAKDALKASEELCHSATASSTAPTATTTSSPISETQHPETGKATANPATNPSEQTNSPPSHSSSSPPNSAESQDETTTSFLGEPVTADPDNDIPR